MAGFSWLGRKPKPAPGAKSLPQPAPRTQVPLAVLGEIVDSYHIPASGDPDSSAEVTIAENDSFGQYIVRLPALDEKQAQALALLKSNLRSSIPVEVSGSPRQVLEKYLWETAEKAGLLSIVQDAHTKFLYYIMKDFTGFWEIDPLVSDDSIEEISVTRHDRPVRVVHRKFSEYRFMETNVTYESEDRLQAFIRRMAQFGGTTVSLAQPSLEVVLQGASDLRVSATLGDEISRPGSTYSIRKQKEKPLTIVQLAAPQGIRLPDADTSGNDPQPDPYNESTYHKTLSALMAAYFWLFLERTTNVLVCGETSSGKTTLMNAVLSMMDPRAKIVTAEDVPEISLSSELHWQRMKTRAHRAGLSPATGGYEYGLSDLLKLALRFSPTILSLGEMRGEESETVATAITLGFSTITTVHAEDAERCVQRVTTPPMRFQEGHVRDVTAIATMRKILLPDGSTARRVVSVDEVRPVGHDSHEILNVFRYDFASDCFSPATPEEVLERSFRLKEMAEGLGWTNERVLGSLTRRAAYVSKAVSAGGFSPSDLSAMVRSYMVKEAPRELERAAT
jgi:archaeal flagellar protein FlaI